MTQEKWDATDRYSREVFKDVLVRRLKFTSIQESTGNCSWDVKGVSPKGYRVGFELKCRTGKYGQYKDMVVEKHKYDANSVMVGRPDEPELGFFGFDKFFVVSIYPESGILAMADLIKDARGETQNQCNNATLVDDWSHDKREKTLVHYPYKYTCDLKTGNWTALGHMGDAEEKP